MSMAMAEVSAAPTTVPAAPPSIAPQLQVLDRLPRPLPPYSARQQIFAAKRALRRGRLVWSTAAGWPPPTWFTEGVVGWAEPMIPIK